MIESWSIGEGVATKFGGSWDSVNKLASANFMQAQKIERIFRFEGSQPQDGDRFTGVLFQMNFAAGGK